MEILWKGTISVKTMWKLCLFTKFPYQEIRWNYATLRSVIYDKLHSVYKGLSWFPVGIYLLKVNNRNTRTRSEICSKLTIKTPKRRQWIIVNFENISHLVLVFLLLTLSMELPTGFSFIWLFLNQINNFCVV